MAFESFDRPAAQVEAWSLPDGAAEEAAPAVLEEPELLVVEAASSLPAWPGAAGAAAVCGTGAGASAAAGGAAAPAAAAAPPAMAAARAASAAAIAGW